MQKCSITTYVPESNLYQIDKTAVDPKYSSICIYATDTVGNFSRWCSEVVKDNEDENTEGVEETSVSGGEEESSSQIEQKAEEKPKQDRVVKQYTDLIFQTFEDIGQILIDIDVPVQTLNFVILLFFILALVLIGRNIYVAIYSILLDFFVWIGVRSKGQPYGIVYDAVTKEPLSKVIVRVFNKEGKLVYSDVTDAHGVFDIAGKVRGKIKLVVQANGYKFPSKLIKNDVQDGVYKNIYKGEFIEVKKESSNISVAIPLDPKKIENAKHIGLMFSSRFKTLSRWLGAIINVIGFVLSIYSIWRYGSSIAWLLFFSFALMFIFKWIDSKRYISGGKWGKVLDNKNKPVKGLELHLVDSEFNTVVAKRITNDSGEYRFVVSPGKYKIKIGNASYKIVKGQKVVYDFSNKKNGDYVIYSDLKVRKI